MRAVSVLRSIPRVMCVSRTAVTGHFYTRSVSTTHRVYNIAPELTQALAREIQAEQQLSQENLGGSAAPSFQGFNISTKGAEVRLTKQFSNESILVVFNVNHSVDMGDDYEEDVQSEVTQVPVALPPFTVEITKGDERLCFHLELVESVDVQGEYDFRVEEFYVAPAVKDDNEDVAADIYASSGKYIDPDLHDLLFVRYLEERGFDGQFCKTLVAFATHHEHSQYVGLLNRIKAFVSK
ncbi:hypothetical protein DICVIV_03762 [Dictyocaulus viviparus]|uniref:Uncharacterized protein n=1 Tax=Dictyocaulus viviparus TaxID=29172 RepID=A0A0D8Y083_DICVI|nr:hypothetical protein DICVIV_03762 [Dictyocaulus viviparus]